MGVFSPMANELERFRPEVTGRDDMVELMACVVNPLEPLVTPPRQPDRQAHDLAYEPHELFWDKECAVRPNGLGCRLFED